MTQPNYAELHAQAEEFLPLLQSTMKELRYGSPIDSHASYYDALVVRFGFFFGWKYQVRSINRLGQEGGGVYFDPTEDGMGSMQAYLTTLLRAHHKPSGSPIIQAELAKQRAEGKVPELFWYLIPRAEPLDMEKEMAAHEQRMSELKVKEVQPGEKL